MSTHTNGKGDSPRHVDGNTWRANYDAIFGKRRTPKVHATARSTRFSKDKPSKLSTQFTTKLSTIRKYEGFA